MDRVILCMKWGTLYEPEYVNVLFNAARANITGDFRFVCLTDNTAGFVDGVEAYPIPDIGLRSQDYHHGAWPKLTVFSKNLYGLKGRALFIDLDTVICGNLDQMFDYIGGLTALDSRPWRYKSGPARTGTGVFGFEIGSMDYVVEKIKENKSPILVMHGKMDTLVPFFMGKKIYEEANNPKYSYFPNGSGHMMRYDPYLVDALQKFINSL